MNPVRFHGNPFRFRRTPDRREFRRQPLASIAFVAFFLTIASLLWMQTAQADESLLRGPRKTIRTNAAAVEPAAEQPGIMERIAAAPVHFYQRFLGPSWGRRCSYYPSCSNYALLAIRKHGAVTGSIMAFDRLQHESDEARHSPPILAGGEIKVYDPLENNDYWWYSKHRSEPVAPADADQATKP
jgi:hypothetical protein